MLVGHRGYRDGASPSGNTLKSFARGAGCASGIELDVQLTRDGELVVFHDLTTGGLLSGDDVAVVDTTLHDLKTRTFLKPADADETVPTLEEVMLLCERLDTHVVVELKGLGYRYMKQLAKGVADLLLKNGWVERCTFISFDPRGVYAVRALLPEVPAMLIVKPYLISETAGVRNTPILSTLFGLVDNTYTTLALTPYALPSLLGATGMSAACKMWTARLVYDAEAAGLQTNAWTVNSRTEADRLREIGVHVLTSDTPDLI